MQCKLGERATISLRLLKDRTVLTGSLFLALSNASSYVVSDPHHKTPYCFEEREEGNVVHLITRNSTTSLSTFKLSAPPQPSNQGSNSSPCPPSNGLLTSY